MNDEITMRFGKYKGERLADIPVSYLDWVIGQDWLGDPLNQQIVEHLETSRAKEWSELSED